MEFLTHAHLAFIFGLLGNIISFLVFLAPVPTFYTIWKRKTSEGFLSIPYVIALMSATLLLYYGILKTNANLIISINAIGCAIEITYIVIYLIYAPQKEKMFTLKMISFINIGSFGIVLLLTSLLFKGSHRVAAVGWICAAFNLAVFASPLSIVGRVIRTKSVEYMPFSLSFFLTLCATAWFFYGFFVKDLFIALPNIVGFLLGIVQMIVYLMYKNAKKDLEKPSEQSEGTMDVKVNSKTGNEEFRTKNNDQRIQMVCCDCQHNKSNENNV